MEENKAATGELQEPWLASQILGSNVLRLRFSSTLKSFQSKFQFLEMCCTYSEDRSKLSKTSTSAPFTVGRPSYPPNVSAGLPRISPQNQCRPRLLLPCMKLITDHPISNTINWARNSLYYSARSLHRSIRCAKRYSTTFLHAGLLILLYELGHAIHPEAQASVVANAELGLKLGINEAASRRMEPPPSSWTESEERTRAWSGVMMLDR
jgi:hypothetical protein